MATHTFKLYKSLIYETVKNETHITAHTTRATDSNTSELAYHEEAGDESYHDRKLERELYASLDKIKAELIGYLDTATENINTTINDDEITFSIELNSRYNSAYLKPLADLVSKYVEDNMLFEWWTPINANNAKVYAEHTELDRQSILKCFIKNAPSTSGYSYANVAGSVDGSTGSDMVLLSTIHEAQEVASGMDDGTKKTALNSAITTAYGVIGASTSESQYQSAITTLKAAIKTAKS